MSLRLSMFLPAIWLLLTGLLLTATATHAQLICLLQQLTNAAEPPPETSFRPAANADGSRVVFDSMDDLTGDNADRNREIFLWDNGVLTQLTNTVGSTSSSARISNDGMRMVFESDADLTGSNADGGLEIFSYDGVNFTQLTDGPSGAQTRFPVISANGQRVAFESTADLTGDNPDGSLEVFLLDGGTLTQISQSPAGTLSASASISDDGTHVAFISTANPLGQNADSNQEVFLWNDLSLTQITQTVGAGSTSANVDVNGDGSMLVFFSTADLTGMSPPPVAGGSSSTTVHSNNLPTSSSQSARPPSAPMAK